MFFRNAGALCALTLFLFSSCSSSSRQWVYHENRAHMPHTNSARLILYPELGEGPFELELIRSSIGIRMYLNICRMEAPPHPDYPKRSTVELCVDNEAMTVHPYILGGGQRLLFPDDITNIIIQALLEGHIVELKMGYRKFHIVSNSFKEAYEGFLAVPLSL